jgi:hypothetical protein
MKKLIAISMIFISIALHGQDSYAIFKGQVFDAITHDTLMYAPIYLEKDGKIIIGGASNLDGSFILKPVPPGIYNVHVRYVCYKSWVLHGLEFHANDTISFEIHLQEAKEDCIIEPSGTIDYNNVRQDNSPGLLIDERIIRKSSAERF